MKLSRRSVIHGLLLLLLLGTLVLQYAPMSDAAAVPSAPHPSAAPPPSMPRPGFSETTQYTVPLSAVHNASTTTVTLSSTTPWTRTAGSRSAYLNLGVIAVGWLSWNGSVTLRYQAQLEFTSGLGFLLSGCAANVGTVWANLTVGATTYPWSSPGSSSSFSCGPE